MYRMIVQSRSGDLVIWRRSFFFGKPVAWFHESPPLTFLTTWIVVLNRLAISAAVPLAVEIPKAMSSFIIALAISAPRKYLSRPLEIMSCIFDSVEACTRCNGFTQAGVSQV